MLVKGATGNPCLYIGQFVAETCDITSMWRYMDTSRSYGGMGAEKYKAASLIWTTYDDILITRRPTLKKNGKA